ncbi:hypothetical protein ACFVY9_25390 [Streptomyces sp. NPDC059544]|uniref:DUF7919 family protein n=1 Tax=Streptomyces sp. NPDC059544 TaxID=3346861 RepID=UPI0036A1AC71
MFYEDLSRYDYTEDGDTFYDPHNLRIVRFEPPYERLNIGWLSDAEPWASGPAPAGFIDKLLAVIEAQAINQMLGIHPCDSCAIPFDDPHPWYVPRTGNRCASWGTGEIRVPGTSGTAFAAPTLIGHYVADHGYLPPKAFTDAVLAFDPHTHRPPRHPWFPFPWIPEDVEPERIE